MSLLDDCDQCLVADDGRGGEVRFVIGNARHEGRAREGDQWADLYAVSDCLQVLHRWADPATRWQQRGSLITVEDVAQWKACHPFAALRARCLEVQGRVSILARALRNPRNRLRPDALADVILELREVVHQLVDTGIAAASPHVPTSTGTPAEADEYVGALLRWIQEKEDARRPPGVELVLEAREQKIESLEAASANEPIIAQPEVEGAPADTSADSERKNRKRGPRDKPALIKFKRAVERGVARGLSQERAALEFTGNEKKAQSELRKLRNHKEWLG
jgi:predicted transcriptional regulator